jgi:FAD/FMN-containing dehydrogenase
MLNEMAPIYIVLLSSLSALLVSGLFIYGVVSELRGTKPKMSAPKARSGTPAAEAASVSAPYASAAIQTAVLAHASGVSPLFELLKKSVRGDVSNLPADIAKMSRDTSLFTLIPKVVVYPKDASDVSSLVKAIHEAREQHMPASVTARSAGTDMSGGPLTDSVVAVFTKYMNKVLEVGDGYAVTQPGVFYRDFEKETLKRGYLLPSYPASREICAMGGIVNNNSGGERTLEYGKTEKYVEELEVVLSDGTITTFKALNREELTQKQSLQTLEGDIYRKMATLIRENGEAIEKARPHVSKNSAGYALWNVVDKKTGRFNLAKLITGAQGTLAFVTKAKLSLVKPQPHRAMLIVFLTDLAILPQIVRKVLPFNPESFESYDDHTLKLAVRFMPQMLSQMGLRRAARLGFSFLPEVGLVLRGGVPKLVLMAEFSDETAARALARATEAEASIASLKLPMRIAKDERAAEKYWIVRRESFALLRKNLKGLYASPFIDDFVVPPESYPKFIPELNALMAQYDLIYTIAGHIGDGNFHIIPLMDVSKPEARKVILELAPKVYELVIRYGGTTTGEHNDGIIRTPYLPMLFGDKIVSLFRQTKQIFDPENIFNPGKKVGGTFADIEKDMIRHM